jgi:hypothetical protein
LSTWFLELVGWEAVIEPLEKVKAIFPVSHPDTGLAVSPLKTSEAAVGTEVMVVDAVYVPTRSTPL